MGFLESDCFGEYDGNDEGCLECSRVEKCKEETEKKKEEFEETPFEETPLLGDAVQARTPWYKDGGLVSKEENPPLWYYLFLIIFPLLWPFAIYKLLNRAYRKIVGKNSK